MGVCAGFYNPISLKIAVRKTYHSVTGTGMHTYMYTYMYVGEPWPPTLSGATHGASNLVPGYLCVAACNVMDAWMECYSWNARNCLLYLITQ